MFTFFIFQVVRSNREETLHETMSSAWTLLEAIMVSLVGNTSYFLPFLTHWLLFLYRKSRKLVTLTFS